MPVFGMLYQCVRCRHIGILYDILLISYFGRLQGRNGRKTGNASFRLAISFTHELTRVRLNESSSAPICVPASAMRVVKTLPATTATRVLYPTHKRELGNRCNPRQRCQIGCEGGGIGGTEVRDLVMTATSLTSIGADELYRTQHWLYEVPRKSSLLQERGHHLSVRLVTARGGELCLNGDPRDMIKISWCSDTAALAERVYSEGIPFMSFPRIGMILRLREYVRERCCGDCARCRR
ncbi:hypothetical protein R3P38DRAFT_2784577 [Favolaschia claudopus]|uniref:Uncharacterized protein n=1 Tax=Favolaschia claudopus TaxID=2862362 RepID=A0AAW0AX17_9AGAR